MAVVEHHHNHTSTGPGLESHEMNITVVRAMTSVTMVALTMALVIRLVITATTNPTLELCRLHPVTTMTGTVTTDTDQVVVEVIGDTLLHLTHQIIHLTVTVEGPGLILQAANTVAATTRQGDQGG